MNAEIRALIEKQANDAADLFRLQLLEALLPKRTFVKRVPAKTAPIARKPGQRADGAPLQLCPVPRCTNAAAPVFGMVCARHKNISKDAIAKYRAARKAAALKARKAKAS